MLTTAGADARPRPAVHLLSLMTTAVLLAAVLPGQRRAVARRVWSYAVYNVGYRLLSVQLSWGSLAVGGVPFVMKYV